MQIIYLLHKKFVINSDKLSPAERNLINSKLKEDFESITWLTYRSELEYPILNSTYYSDAGWGCMLRTGQMLLFQALQRHIFGDNFTQSDLTNNKENMREYLNLLRL